MKKILSVLAVFMAVTFCFAQEEKSPLTFYTGTDFAYYPKSDFVKGESSHFAPLTGVYSGLEGRITAHLDYTLATPLGSHWLLNSANVIFGSTFEITPVSLKPGVNVKFTPLPFLVFSAGAEIGTGWNLLGMQGMARYTGIADNWYEDLNPFGSWFYKWWAQGTFQFDTGAIWKGDWTHVQMMYTYQVYYEGMTGVENGQIWEWQLGDPKVNGLRNYQNIVLAYGLPSVCNRVGVMIELDGYYEDTYDSTKYPGYDGDFTKISISPLAQFQFTKKDSLSLLLGFSSRRVFAQSHESSKEEPKLIAVEGAREWYFNRFALSYTHRFF